MLLESLISYRSNQSPEAKEIAQDILSLNCTPTQKLRAKFYKVMSLDLNDIEERKKLYLEVIEDSNQLLKQDGLKPAGTIDTLQLLSVYNKAGQLHAHLQKLKVAKEYLDKSIK